MRSCPDCCLVQGGMSTWQMFLQLSRSPAASLVSVRSLLGGASFSPLVDGLHRLPWWI